MNFFIYFYFVIVSSLDSVVIGFSCMGMILTALLAWTYSRINAHRDAQELKGENLLGSYSIEERAALGDRAPDFRYAL